MLIPNLKSLVVIAAEFSAFIQTNTPKLTQLRMHTNKIYRDHFL